MRILLTSVVILVVSRVSNGQSQSAVRLPSSYRNGVKWSLATNYQPLTLLETVATPEEESIVYILPAGERGIQNYGLHTYANDHEDTVRATGFSTTESPSSPTFVSHQHPITVPENKLRASFAAHPGSFLTHVNPVASKIKSDYQNLQEYPFLTQHLTPVQEIKSTDYQNLQKYPSSFLTHHVAHPLPNEIKANYQNLQKFPSSFLTQHLTPVQEIKSTDYQRIQEPLSTYNIAHDYLTNLLSRSSVPPKTDIVTATYTPQLDAKSKISFATYTTTAKPFGSSIVSETYTPGNRFEFSGKYTPILSTYSSHFPVNQKSTDLLNGFGNGLSAKTYQQPIISSTTYKPLIAD